ncbi:MAG TPA: hypothetical protein VGM69_04820 [Chloroflexota bacterium]|jgi:hypothetical protein
MTQLPVDPMDNPALWPTSAPDGTAPSPELSVAAETGHVRFGADGVSLRLRGTTAALDHRARRDLAGLDLGELDELRFWAQSDRPADGSLARPFFLEVRLASAAMGLADPANGWHRLVPIATANAWELVRLSLADLPAAVRSAVTTLQLRCVDATAPFTLYLDDLLAVREELIADVDAALLARLHGRLTLGGAPVPALISHPENPPTAAIPSIRLTQYGIRLALERMRAVETRSDFTTNGFRTGAAGVPYELFYEIDVFADTRPDKARIAEFVLRTLNPPLGELLVNDVPLPIEWVAVEPMDPINRGRGDRSLLHFKVLTRQETGTPQPARPPYSSIVVEADQATAAR